MLLKAFIVLQILLDVEIMLVLFWRMRRKRSAPSPPAELPESYREFQRLAEDVLMVVEPVLEAMESGALQRLSAPAAIAPPSAAALPPATAAPVADERSARDRHREARALLRAGTPPDEVARREKLRPGELRLIENLVAAEARLTTASSS